MEGGEGRSGGEVRAAAIFGHRRRTPVGDARRPGKARGRLGLAPMAGAPESPVATYNLDTKDLGYD